MEERYKELEIRKNPQENIFSFLLIFEKYSTWKTFDNFEISYYGQQNKNSTNSSCGFNINFDYVFVTITIIKDNLH